MDEWVVGERLRNLQLDGFGRLNPQFLVDRFMQSLSAAASDLSATTPDVTNWFPNFVSDYF